MTEYFLASDLSYLLSETLKFQYVTTADDFTLFFKSLVTMRKEISFPASMRPSNMSTDTTPDWTSEIGGLGKAKSIIEDMFGVTQ
jgi:hypothetical protein